MDDDSSNESKTPSEIHIDYLLQKINTKKKRAKPLPPLPQLPLEVLELFDESLQARQPKILQDYSWTRAVPQKV